MGSARCAVVRPEADPADGDAVPVSAVGLLHRTRRRLGRRHELRRLLHPLSLIHVRAQHLQVHLQAKGERSLKPESVSIRKLVVFYSPDRSFTRRLQWSPQNVMSFKEESRLGVCCASLRLFSSARGHRLLKGYTKAQKMTRGRVSPTLSRDTLLFLCRCGAARCKH